MPIWDVLRAYSIIAQHDKYAVCICADPGNERFFFINSEPRRFRDAQVPVTPADLPCLHHANGEPPP